MFCRVRGSKESSEPMTPKSRMISSLIRPPGLKVKPPTVNPSGSVAGAGLFPLAVWMIDHPATPLLLAALAGGGFIIWRHSANIERLRAGTENVFTFARKKAA